MKITVMGGGNVGTLVAGQLSKNHSVTLLTRKPERFGEIVEVHDEDEGTVESVQIERVTNDPAAAIEGADLVISTVPAVAAQGVVENCVRYMTAGQMLCFYPGTGGAELLCGPLLERGCIVFGAQRIRSVARLNEYGASVRTSGKRKTMHVGALNPEHGETVRALFQDLFDAETRLLPNYLSVTLTPSNPILHTSRLHALFKDYAPGVVYPKIPLFYEDWDEDSSTTLIRCDEELQRVCQAFPGLDLSGVRPLLEHYESGDARSLTEKIRSIESFKGLTTPQVEVDGGAVPDLASRYFTADFPYGLFIIKAFALIAEVPTPAIDVLLDWYQDVAGTQYFDFERGRWGEASEALNLPHNRGLDTVAKVSAFYGPR